MVMDKSEELLIFVEATHGKFTRDVFGKTFRLVSAFGLEPAWPVRKPLARIGRDAMEDPPLLLTVPCNMEYYTKPVIKSRSSS